ncbi:HxlR family transcriptional regulator [Pseudonocardia sulfidoxydans NBRC 16205]|uniref:HxlR family transcriptional regulator n=1 Tax=Pseudonocardia sulfidoxydans NBRC 16205 TaxID=1223511 RepID=A0A511DRF6_9PSEU|nr:helix-turn-helix domain-containing protein [Pseudonocardia sulfidoxydans]GEL26897.1 HxlR family transcriptional regulator [Pseudonocardia sulfidoxydans NBRC 16205]
MSAAGPEYCPVSMAATVLCERWNLLIIRELYVGARGFNDIHRGLPGLSRTLLSQRLRALQQSGLVESVAGNRGYRLTERGADLEDVLVAVGNWGVRWAFPEPADERLDPHLLMWRMRLGLRSEALPDQRVTVELIFEQGREQVRGWLVLDGEDSSVCTRDPMFDVDVHARAKSEVWYSVWYGHRGWSEVLEDGEMELSGRPALLRDFPTWFRRSDFAPRVAERRADASS